MKKSKHLYLVLTLLIVGITIFPNNAFASSWDKGDDPIVRVSGSDRYATNLQTSKNYMLKASGETTKNSVVLVNGESYPDAMISVSLAHTRDNFNYGSSVLLYNPSYTSIQPDLESEIKRLLGTASTAKTVYLVGNVPDSLKTQVQSWNYSAVKLAGSDRYQTAYQVATEMERYWDVNTAILVNGETYADAIGVLGYAGNKNIPILLTGTDSLNSWAQSAITQNGITNVIIVGGTGVVSTTVENQVKNLGVTVTRNSGADMYQTNSSFNFNNFSYDNARTMLSTSGEGWPDAIGAGLVASRFYRPIVLTPSSYLHSAAQNYINYQSKMDPQIDQIILVGGGVTSDTKTQMFNAGWWWAPWATLYVDDINPTKQLKITSYMDFYTTFNSDYGPYGTNDVDYENNWFLPWEGQNVKVIDSYTNLPMRDYWYRFFDGSNTSPEHDWVMGTDVPENLTTTQTYYTQAIVGQADSRYGIPYASSLKIYAESQFKIYGDYPDISTSLIDQQPAWEYIDKKNL